MNTKHTPGPWTVSDKTDGACPVVLFDGFRRVCKVHGMPGQLFANACLIAAAPDLLEALSDAAAMLEVYTAGKANAATRGQAVSTIRDARKAIAKATGTAA